MLDKLEVGGHFKLNCSEPMFEQCSGGASIYEWHMSGCRSGQRRKQRLSLCACRCLSEQLPLYVPLCVPLYVPLCVLLLARATAWLPDSAWESAFTAPPCSTRPRQACPFLPLQRQYNHQMTQTTQFFNKPQDSGHRPFKLQTQSSPRHLHQI